MKNYDKAKPLISIHIPKCAGMSFLDVLQSWFKYQSWFKNDKLLLHYFDERNNKMPHHHNLKTGFIKKDFKKGICIHGHFNNLRGFGIKDYYPEVDQFITILRDPFEIAVSNYFFVKQAGSNSFRNGKRHAVPSSLDEYLSKHSKSHIQYFFPFEITMSNFKELIEKYFVYIGIAEDLQTSVNILSEKLGRPRAIVPHKNTSKHNQAYKSELKAKFMEDNLLEYALYNFVLENYKHW